MNNFWALTFKGGNFLYTNYELRDSANNTVYEFKTDSKPYFQLGLGLT